MSSLRTIVRSCTLAIAAAAVFAVAAGPASAAPTHYVETSDGASIAINVKVPPHCNALNKCPTFFEMSGYESGSDEGKTPAGHLADQTGLPFPLQTGTRAAHASHVDDRYVTVLASVRGTGCSSGEFDLFSWRSALDGKEVIDKWIAKQPWSNGKVVIFGHSYSGITGLFVASTRPEALRAVSSSGLIGDLYRLVTESYLHRLGLDRPRTRWVKSIVDPDRAVRVGNTALYFHYADSERAVDELHQTVRGHQTDAVSVSLLRINHYFTRSKVERERKLGQLRPDNGQPRNAEGVEKRDLRLNEEYDDTILAYIASVRGAAADD